MRNPKVAHCLYPGIFIVFGDLNVAKGKEEERRLSGIKTKVWKGTGSAEAAAS